MAYYLQISKAEKEALIELFEQMQYEEEGNLDSAYLTSKEFGDSVAKRMGEHPLQWDDLISRLRLVMGG